MLKNKYFYNFQDLNDQETFKNEELDSHIEIDLPTKPQSSDEDSFVLVVIKFVRCNSYYDAF